MSKPHMVVRRSARPHLEQRCSVLSIVHVVQEKPLRSCDGLSLACKRHAAAAKTRGNSGPRHMMTACVQHLMFVCRRLGKFPRAPLAEMGSSWASSADPAAGEAMSSDAHGLGNIRPRGRPASSEFGEYLRGRVNSEYANTRAACSESRVRVLSWREGNVSVQRQYARRERTGLDERGVIPASDEVTTYLDMP